MLDGHMLHEDHLGHRGDLKSGGVQWMTAGRGIIHSEMPQQESGRMRGFQLWINLPASEKMKPAGYRDIDASEIPEVDLPGGGTVRVIAGVADVGGSAMAGSDRRACRPSRCTSTCTCRPARRSRIRCPAGHSAFVYPYEGALAIGGTRTAARIPQACSPTRRRRRRPRRRGRTLPAARREAAARAGGAVRAVRDEHARRDRAGDPRLPGRGVRARLRLPESCSNEGIHTSAWRRQGC